MMDVPVGLEAGVPDAGKPLPLDLSHYYSEVTKHRVASKIKQVYKLFQIPGILNLAGGLPNAQFFPFDTLEAQAAQPERWTPTPNYPGQSGAASSSNPQAATHIAVPKASGEEDVMKRIDLSTALQYGLAQGYPPLYNWVLQFTRENLHPDVPYEGGPDVAMTCGSTDGFSKVLRLFVNPWSEDIHDICDRPGLLCETFVYGSILSECLPRGMAIAPVQMDSSGMLVTGPGGLEDVLANWDFSKGKRPHLMYMVTQGHNPTGFVLSLERKREIYAVCSKYDVIIIEDEPYWYLQFPSAAGEEAKSRSEPTSQETERYRPAIASGYPFLDSLAPSFLSIDTDGRVVRLDTFSKTVAPGCRLGWITAQPAVIERYIRVSETSTQQPSGFVQSLVAELVIGPQPEAKAAFQRASRDGSNKFSGWRMDGWVRWLEGLRGVYERRMVRMCRILDEGAHHIKAGRFANPDPADADADWGVVTKTKLLDFAWPRGGMFVWVRVYFERHPLWGAAVGHGDDDDDGRRVVDGPMLSVAMMMFLTTKPFLVLASTGTIFSATDEIRDELGWAYYRLCFAAETEENVDISSRRFVDGVHKFFRIKSVEQIEKLVGTFPSSAEPSDLAGNTGMAQLGTWMGC